MWKRIYGRKKQDREEYIARGQELLEKELRKQKISVANALTDEHKNKIMNDLGVKDFEEVLLQIGSLRYTPTYIVNLLYIVFRNKVFSLCLRLRAFLF